MFSLKGIIIALSLSFCWCLIDGVSRYYYSSHAIGGIHSGQILYSEKMGALSLSIDGAAPAADASPAVGSAEPPFDFILPSAGAIHSDATHHQHIKGTGDDASDAHRRGGYSVGTSGTGSGLSHDAGLSPDSGFLSNSGNINTNTNNKNNINKYYDDKESFDPELQEHLWTTDALPIGSDNTEFDIARQPPAGGGARRYPGGTEQQARQQRLWLLREQGYNYPVPLWSSQMIWRPVNDFGGTPRGQEGDATNYFRTRVRPARPLLPPALRAVQRRVPRSVIPLFALELAEARCRKRYESSAEEHRKTTSSDPPLIIDGIVRWDCLLEDFLILPYPLLRRFVEAGEMNAGKEHAFLAGVLDKPMRLPDGNPGGESQFDFSPSSGESDRNYHQCGLVYGKALINRYRRATRTVCGEGGFGANAPIGSDPDSQTLFQCSSIRAHPGHNIDSSICEGQNIEVHFSFIHPNHGNYPWLLFDPGALTLRCREPDDGASPSLSAPRLGGRHSHGTRYMHSLADWMEAGFQAVGPSTDSPEPALTWRELVVDLNSGRATERDLDLADPYYFDHSPSAGQRPANGGRCLITVQTPTLFITRSGDFSPFAALHDFLNTLLILVANRYHPLTTQIILMDRMGLGFYSAMFQRLFARARPLLWYADIAEHLQNQPHNNGIVCYKRALFGIPARLSLGYSYDDCDEAPVFALLSELLLNASGALRLAPPAQAFVVTVISRRDYALTGHSIGRRIGNHAALVEGLRQLHHVSLAATEGDIEDTLVPILVNNIDYAEYDFDEQVRISRSTDLLIAMHGAGLVHSLFMHYYAAIFEIFCPEKPRSNYRYEQLAKRRGLLYRYFESIDAAENTVPLAQIIPKIVDTIRTVASRKRAAGMSI